jgi:two-component system phosphate regulon response regulator PhoB
MASKRILCVDDDENICELVVELLGFSDLEAVSALDPGATLRLIEREQFSIYILDGHLAGDAELSLCEQIREVDEETPIVVFSGHDTQADIDAGLLAGASAYIVKPAFAELSR